MTMASTSLPHTRLAFLFAAASASAFQPSILFYRRNYLSLPSPRSFSGMDNNIIFSSSTTTTSASATRLSMTHHGPFPELVVFDLDACFWDQEMYTLSHIPDASHIVEGDLGGRGKGVVGVMSGRHRISLHKGSLKALQSHYDNKYPNMKACFASSADTPLAERIGRAALKLLEVVPGTTVWDLVVERDWNGVDVNQIGRQPPLSANKSATHFPILRELTRVRYDRMLFFDDCLWGDHCGQVERACKESRTKRGPITIRTPNGLGVEEWAAGLEKYAKMYQNLDGVDNYDIKK